MRDRGHMCWDEIGAFLTCVHALVENYNAKYDWNKEQYFFYGIYLMNRNKN